MAAGDNWLQGWMRDRITGSLTEDRRGDYQPGFLENIGGGLVGLDAGKIADDEQEFDTNEDAKKVLKGTGKSRQQLGLGEGMLTPEQVRGAYSEYTEKRSDDKDKTNHQRSMEPLTAQLALTREQGNQTHSLALMQMADNKDARAADLERERRRERKDDIRYNERMDQLDRKDRRMMQQTLAAGLASLGAAFAL